jgi:hypothetical protein
MKSNPFRPIYTRRGRLNQRQTILKMAREIPYKSFTAFEISDAIYSATGGEIKIAVSLCDLTLRKNYYKVAGSPYFSRTEPAAVTD